MGGAHAYIDVQCSEDRLSQASCCVTLLLLTVNKPQWSYHFNWAVLYMCTRAFPCVLRSNADPCLTPRATSSLCCFFLWQRGNLKLHIQLTFHFCRMPLFLPQSREAKCFPNEAQKTRDSNHSTQHLLHRPFHPLTLNERCASKPVLCLQTSQG